MSASAGTGASIATSTVSAAMPRQRSRWARTLALPPSPYVPSNDGNTSAIRTADSRLSHDLAIALERRVVREYVDRSGRTTCRAGRANRLRQIVDANMLDSGVT